MGQRYEKDVATILAEQRSDFIAQRRCKYGDTLETIMLRVELNVREMDDPDLIAQMARCYSDPDLTT